MDSYAGIMHLPDTICVHSGIFTFTLNFSYFLKEFRFSYFLVYLVLHVT